MPLSHGRARRAAPVLLITLALGAALAGCGDDEPQQTLPEVGAATSGSAAADGAAGALVQSGLDQLSAGDAASAKVTFGNVLAIDPTNLYANYNLGYLAQSDGDAAGALAFYETALTTDADYVPALFNQAILTESTDLDAAIAIYRRIIGIDDQMAASYMRLGFALIYQGEQDEGKQLLAQGIAIDPAMADVQAPAYTG